jgi:ribosomal protein S18 acetylase RimI-like enzyme
VTDLRVERVFEDAWERLAHVRLRALRTDPEANGSSLTREESFREPHWRMRLRSSAWWLATQAGGEVPVGLVCLIEEPGSPASDRHLVSLWVAPEARRAGAGTALVTAAADEARSAGAQTLSLWVREDSDGARAFCDRLGFTPTGERHASVARPDVPEARLARPLDTPGDDHMCPSVLDGTSSM